MRLVWGIAAQDHGSLSETYEYGELVLDTGVDLVSEGAQLWLRDLCARVHGMEGTQGVLLGSVQCPMDLVESMLKRQNLELPVSEEVCCVHPARLPASCFLLPASCPVCNTHSHCSSGHRRSKLGSGSELQGSQG